jgi:glycosyltransferase involved in cell wall biosynthesis
MKPSISVIIPAHNEENYIKRTLHSLKNQTFQNFEIIVVTNGCTDKTEEIVKKRVGNNVKYFSMTQANVSRARNYGADKASGEILLFLDADTTLQKDALLRINSDFSKENNTATFLLNYDVNNVKMNLISGLKNMHNKSKIVKTFCGSLICWKEQFDQVQGFNPEKIIGEHYDLRTRIGGQYAVINSQVTTSARRFEKWGLLRVVKTWIKRGNNYEKIR